MREKSSKIYINVIAALIIIIFFAAFFTYQLHENAQESIFNTMTEISHQSVKVVQKEVEKNQHVMANIAASLYADNEKDPMQIIAQLRVLDDLNGFKRMGVILDNHEGYASDDSQFLLNDEQLQRFEKAQHGIISISDNLLDLVDQQPVTLYTAPIEYKDGTQYVLFGTYAAQTYQPLLSVTTFDGQGFSVIMKQDGSQIIGSANQEGTCEQNFYDEILSLSKDNQSTVDELKQAINAGQSGFTSYACKKDIRYIYYEPLAVNDWYLLSIIPNVVITKSIGKTVTLAYSMLALCLIVLAYSLLRVIFIDRRHRRMLERIAWVDTVTDFDSFEKFKMDASKKLDNDPSLYAMIALNINKFQYINDLFGYEEGNRVLKKVAQCLVQRLGRNEYFARIQADHFIVLLTYSDTAQLSLRILDIMNSIQDVVSSTEGEMQYQIQMNAGVYLITDHHEQINTMIDCAALALRKDFQKKYEACAFYDDALREQIFKNKEIEDMFLPALKNQQFSVVYQPKYNVQTQRYEGSEALVRWYYKEDCMISPAYFVPILERNGSIIELDEYVLTQVCIQLRSWLDAGYELTPVSVNASQLHLYRVDFFTSYMEIIDRYQIPHELIEIEMTETALYENEAKASEILNQFRHAGIKILLDDFGSGYSSITLLRNMPIDELKIDKKMLNDLLVSDKARQILAGVIVLAKTIELKVTVEGVEAYDEYEAVSLMGIDKIQGFYCARPMKADEYEKRYLIKA